MPRAKALAGVVGDAGWVGPGGAPDDLAAGAPGPDFKLVGGGRPERVAGTQHDRLALILEPLRQLGDRGRLARAVDPGNQVDAGLLRRDGQDPGVGVLEQALQLVLDEGHQVLVGRLVGVRLTHPVDDPARGHDAHIGLDQAGLKVVEERLVHLAAEPGADVEQLRRPGQPLLEPFQQPFDRHVRPSSMTAFRKLEF